MTESNALGEDAIGLSRGIYWLRRDGLSHGGSSGEQTGHAVAVYNRSADKAESWREAFGGEICATPALAAADCDFVCVCVGNDDDVRQVVLGDEGVLAGMKAGAVLIDHTTASAHLARELAHI